MAVTEHLARWGAARLSRRVSRSIPILGAAIAAATVVATMRRKGVISGALDTGLNALPGIGAAKNVIEVARGRDFFPDRPRSVPGPSATCPASPLFLTVAGADQHPPGPVDGRGSLGCGSQQPLRCRQGGSGWLARLEAVCGTPSSADRGRAAAPTIAATSDGTPAASHPHSSTTVAGALSRIEVAAPSDSTATRAGDDRFITSLNSSAPSSVASEVERAWRGAAGSEAVGTAERQAEVPSAPPKRTAGSRR